MKNDPFTRHFMETLLSDSRLEEQRNEPGQAFDKLIRALQSQFPEGEYPREPEKASELFKLAAQHDEVWSCYLACGPNLLNLSQSLRYYLQMVESSDADLLVKKAQAFNKAVFKGDRSAAADSFARWAIHFRNKRFHGNSAFSGDNVRLAHDIALMLDLLRAHVNWLLVEGLARWAA